MGESKRRKQAMGSAYGKPRPVPFSERKPRPIDCDETGAYWAWNDLAIGWASVRDEDISDEPQLYTHWLPRDAIPYPPYPDWMAGLAATPRNPEP